MVSHGPRGVGGENSEKLHIHYKKTTANPVQKIHYTSTKTETQTPCVEHLTKKRMLATQEVVYFFSLCMCVCLEFYMYHRFLFLSVSSYATRMKENYISTLLLTQR